MALDLLMRACRYAEKQVGYMACSILLNEVRSACCNAACCWSTAAAFLSISLNRFSRSKR